MKDDSVGKAFASVSTTVDLTGSQLNHLLAKQRETWSPQPREHSTETAFSNTDSNRTAISKSPNKRWMDSPLGSLRNEQTRSRTKIRRSDLFSRKSLTNTDLARPTSDVDTALLISPTVKSTNEDFVPLRIIQTTSMSRSPAKSYCSEERISTAKARSRSSAKRSLSAPQTPKSQLKTAKVPKAEANQEMVIEKMADGRVKVSVILDISAPDGKIGIEGKAPAGMRFKCVSVNGAKIFSVM